MNKLFPKSVSLQIQELLKERYCMNTETDLKPYTMEEINAMLDQAESNFAAGLGIPGEVVFRELEEEFAKEDAESQLESI